MATGLVVDLQNWAQIKEDAEPIQQECNKWNGLCPLSSSPPAPSPMKRAHSLPSPALLSFSPVCPPHPSIYAYLVLAL